MYDLVCIGGGLSCSFTLVSLLERLGARGTGERDGALRRVAMLDRDGDFGVGLPYGRFAHPRVLLNETVQTMDVHGFGGWVADQRARWLGMLQDDPDGGVVAWLAANDRALSRAREDPAAYRPLHLPRRIFGLFVRERLHASIDDARRHASADVDLLTGEAVLLTRDGSGAFRLGLRDGRVIHAGRVLLGVGSLPSSLAPHLAGLPGFVANVCRDGPSLETVAADARLEQAASKRAVIVGGNAAAMEAVYTLRHMSGLSAALDEIVVISPSGFLPDGEPSPHETAFVAQRLRQLGSDAAEPTADQLMAVVTADVEAARRAGYASLDYAAPIVEAFGRVFAGLTVREKRLFVERYGKAFTRLRRHTPPEYAAAAKGLMARGKLRIMRGRATSVACSPTSRPGFTVMIRQEAETLSLDAAVVVDCSGSEPLTRPSHPLLRNLLGQDDLARVNAAGAGIEVTSALEASPGLFVMGPLLAGHSSDAAQIWRLESAPRICSLAQRLATELATHIT